MLFFLSYYDAIEECGFAIYLYTPVGSRPYLPNLRVNPHEATYGYLDRDI